MAHIRDPSETDRPALDSGLFKMLNGDANCDESVRFDSGTKLQGDSK